GPELGAHFRLHQRLAQHAHPFAQEIHILIHPDLAQGSQQVDTLPRGHRVPSFSVSVHTLRRTRRWPSPSTALALTHSLGFYPTLRAILGSIWQSASTVWTKEWVHNTSGQHHRGDCSHCTYTRDKVYHSAATSR